MTLVWLVHRGAGVRDVTTHGELAARVLFQPYASRLTEGALVHTVPDGEAFERSR